MQMSSFENLAAYATEDRIIRLIAKERGKYTAKNGGPSNPFKNDVLFNQIRSMCPPHSLWHNPGRGKLPKKATHGLARWTSRKKRASVQDCFALPANHSPWSSRIISCTQPCHLSRKSERILTARVPLFHRYSAKFYNFVAS